jgi:hypothetical protein
MDWSAWFAWKEANVKIEDLTPCWRPISRQSVEVGATVAYQFTGGWFGHGCMLGTSEAEVTSSVESDAVGTEECVTDGQRWGREEKVCHRSPRLE